MGRGVVSTGLVSGVQRAAPKPIGTHVIVLDNKHYSPKGHGELVQHVAKWAAITSAGEVERGARVLPRL